MKRPGYYYLARGSTLRDAIRAARGLRRGVIWERPSSGLQSVNQDGSVIMLWFNPAGHRAQERGLVLKNNDRIRK